MALTELWIYLGFWICTDCKYGRVLNMQQLHRVLNTLQYVWIRLNKAWIWLNISGCLIADRVLNMYNAVRRARSFYELMNRCWKTKWHINMTVLNMGRDAIMEGFWIFQDSGYARFLRMQALDMVLNIPEYGWLISYVRVLKMSSQRLQGFK